MPYTDWTKKWWQWNVYIPKTERPQSNPKLVCATKVFQNQIGIIERGAERKNKIYGSQPGQLAPEEMNVAEIQILTPPSCRGVKVTDFHACFQRIDGKNLLGFNDGISNPFRLSNSVIWTTKEDEGGKFQDGTYMVFQKIEHDLENWQRLPEEKQEHWIGRSKGTDLLLGTLPKK
jgi:hypothetical protein